jgi:hypothetical protein
MKNILFFLYLFFLLACESYGSEAHMKITLVAEEKSIVIYDGTPRSAIIDPIKKARRVNINALEKAVITEGEYLVELFTENGKESFRIQNNYWVYDETNDRFLRCSILSDLRGYLLNYLFARFDGALLYGDG